jgi:outer membrane protein OmpA-like peptidoglycan-associated protein/tetratricopeptide (TPR) repeat protein
MGKLSCLLLIALFSISIAGAQNVDFTKENFPDDKKGLNEAKFNIKRGDANYNYGSAAYPQALDNYVIANNFNSNNAVLNLKMGHCYMYSSTEYDKSIKHLEKALSLNANTDPFVHYLIGWYQQSTESFDEAIKAYKLYDQKKNSSEYTKMDTKSKMEECKRGKKLVAAPLHVKIENLGDLVNTTAPEYKPVISADQSLLIFTSRREGSTGGKLDPYIKEPFEDLYYSENDGSGWTKVKHLRGDVNSDSHDASVGLSPDGQRLLMYLGHEGGDIYECNLKGDKWSEPVKLNENINTKKFQESSACYAPDEKSLYFVSDKEGGTGGKDIYVSELDADGNWGPSKNLGTVINTDMDEEGVFMHPDGKTMYFSSMGHSTIGGFDIFKSVLNNGKWSKPVNIGYPINTAKDDIFFVIAANGKDAYYSSIRSDSYGGRDLYKIEFLKDTTVETPDTDPQLTLLKGVVSDEKTKELLEATIEITDNATNEIVATFKSNSKTGKYLVSLPSGKNYGISVSAPKYLFHSENFDISESKEYQEVEKDVELKRIEVGKKIVLNNIFYDYDEATLRNESMSELGRVVDLMKNNPKIKVEISGHTDSRGSDSYNRTLSENRAKSVVTHLISKGIAKDRLVYKGYGETQLRISDVTISKLTAETEIEAAHQENRRTEFKVIGL